MQRRAEGELPCDEPERFCLESTGKSSIRYLSRLYREELVAALESRFGSAHQQELHCSKFKTRSRRREESLQEQGEDLERLARLAYPSAPDEMKDLLAKEQFIDAILDGDTRLRLKQSPPHSL